MPTTITRERALAVVQSVWRVTWPLLLVVVVFVAVGGIGFSPTDEGLIQANAQRILRGEIPHIDIVSPRPLGSAYLHVVDLLLPTPLVATSRFLGLCEIAAYTVLLASLAFRRGPRQWRLLEALLVATAFLVNVHTFPVTAWHTIDGLLLTSAGFVLLARGLARDRPRFVDAAMFVLGAVLLVKQSFALAPLFGVVWIVAHGHGLGESPTRLARRAVRGLVLAAAPGLAYGVLMTLFGGLGRAVLQLRSGGDQVWTIFSDQLERAFDDVGAVTIAAFVAVLVIAGVDVYRRRRAPDAPAVFAILLVARLVATVGVVELVVSSDLELFGAWGTQLLILLLLVIVWRALAEHDLDGIAALTAAIGLMAMLSWGYAVPDLVGGSLALVVLDRLWRGAPLPEWVAGRPSGRWAVVAVGTAVLVVVAGVFFDARTTDVYRHFPGAALDADLGGIDDDLAGIRANTGVAQYLRQVRDCIEEFPAGRVALLPDNAMLYPVFDLENPLPSDWMFRDELADSREVVIDAARRLSQEGDYLVLFETVPAHSVGYLRKIHRDPPRGRRFYFYGDPIGRQIRRELGGEPITCGSFVGVYSPPGAGHAAT